jgi:hypothetical protein
LTFFEKSEIIRNKRLCETFLLSPKRHFRLKKIKNYLKKEKLKKKGKKNG